MSKMSAPFLIIVCISSFIASYNTMNMLFSPQGKVNLRNRRQALEGFANEYVRKIGKDGPGTHASDSKPEPVLVETVADAVNPVVLPPKAAESEKKIRKFHTACTCSDGPYNRWQVRVMYYWYKKAQAMPGGEEMGGFTRVLHSGVADDIMDEVPTMVVDPLPPGKDRGYVVLNRPWAFVQWLQKADIEEEYIFMAEPDHLIVRPIPNLATERLPSAFHFFYITPKEFEQVLRKYYPADKGPIENIDPIGNSPVIIKKDQLKKIAPVWNEMAVNMKNDPEADKEFGWVLEMYAYATAAAAEGYRHNLRKNFMIQPPWDTKLADTYIIHYTYGCDYTLKGELMYGKIGEWRFDKRSYSGSSLPRNLEMPPEGVPESVVTMLKMFNEATANIPNW